MAVLASRPSDDDEAVAADAPGYGGGPAQVSEIDHGFQWLRPGGGRRDEYKSGGHKNRAGGEYKIVSFIGGKHCFPPILEIEISRPHARRLCAAGFPWRSLGISCVNSLQETTININFYI